MDVIDLTDEREDERDVIEIKDEDDDEPEVVTIEDEPSQPTSSPRRPKPTGKRSLLGPLASLDPRDRLDTLPIEVLDLIFLEAYAGKRKGRVAWWKQLMLCYPRATIPSMQRALMHDVELNSASLPRFMTRLAAQPDDARLVSTLSIQLTDAMAARAAHLLARFTTPQTELTMLELQFCNWSALERIATEVAHAETRVYARTLCLDMSHVFPLSPHQQAYAWQMGLPVAPAPVLAGAAEMADVFRRVVRGHHRSIRIKSRDIRAIETDPLAYLTLIAEQHPDRSIVISNAGLTGRSAQQIVPKAAITGLELVQPQLMAHEMPCLTPSLTLESFTALRHLKLHLRAFDATLADSLPSSIVSMSLWHPKTLRLSGYSITLAPDPDGLRILADRIEDLDWLPKLLSLRALFERNGRTADGDEALVRERWERIKSACTARGIQAVTSSLSSRM